MTHYLSLVWEDVHLYVLSL